MKSSLLTDNDARKVFRQKGTCSCTFCFLLNREFGHPRETEERAGDPLAGGILQKGLQCGMLWGAAMAVGAEAYRRCDEPEEAVALAVAATRRVMQSFTDRTGTINCREITRTDFNKPLQMIRYMLFRARNCFRLAEEWAPEAVEAALDGLALEVDDRPSPCMSCATEVARKMGATDEQAIMVAGFAGGLGLSGGGCGALAAAMWMKSLPISREQPEKMSFMNPDAKAVLRKFEETYGEGITCREISGREFASLEEHITYLLSGGCADVMEQLTNDQKA